MDLGAHLYEEAESFILACYQELGKSNVEIEERLAEIRVSLELDGSYEHTYEELEHGAKMAWRNSNRCIGRLFWQTLKVFDERGLQNEEQISQALYRHIEYATNSGKIRPTLTVFQPERPGKRLRILNHQLVRYAGYETEQGIVGDPHSLHFTRLCTSLGWKGAGGPFDVLPIVIQARGSQPRWFSIPEDLILEVDIHHPDFPSFAELKLKWYAVPMISDMVLEIGGIRYSAAPFNGWYMETEIGARNLADSNRYNRLPVVASLMGLNTKTDATLWKDKALVELNLAVLHSFKTQGVRMIDHHTAATQFGRFEHNEAECQRPVTGDWTWLIPPLSPATTHIFHNQYENRTVKPNYFHQNSVTECCEQSGRG